MVRNTFATLLLLGFAWLVGMRVSAGYRHQREFQNKLPFFQKVIADLQTSPAPPSPSFSKIPVPDDARHLVYSIIAQRPADDLLAVEFLTRLGLPVKHRGFLFLSSGNIGDFPKLAARWPRRTALRDHWFYIGD